MGNPRDPGVSSLQGVCVLTVGDKFPEFELTLDKPSPTAKPYEIAWLNG